MFVFQLEIGENRTEHYQGYFELANAKSISAIKRILGGSIHLEKRMGSRAQAIDYSMKNKTAVDGPWFFPDRKFVLDAAVCKQGKRTDLLEFKNAIVKGSTQHELWENFTSSMAKYPRMYNSVSNLYRPDHTPVEIILCIGEPGSGKSRWAYEEYPNCWTTPIGGGNWYNGYDRDDEVLLDDFSGASSHISVPDLLRLLDRYSVKVPVKGDFCWWCPKTIVITTNIHPRSWYEWGTRASSYLALQRRITRVTFFSKEEAQRDVDRDWFFEQPSGWYPHRILDARPGEPIVIESEPDSEFST